jgi:Ribbon-helix-helix domain
MALERGEDGEKTTRVPISFPEDLYEWLREAAFRRRIPMAEIVREAVREHRHRTDPQLELPMGDRT